MALCSACCVVGRRWNEVIRGTIIMAFVSFSGVTSFFKGFESVIRKGEKSFEAGKIERIALVDGTLITATVRASMKKRKYAVKVSIGVVNVFMLSIVLNLAWCASLDVGH